MFGALIGDLVGSVYEWNNVKRKDFQPLIHPRAFFTDDTVLTVAVADALLNGRGFVESFKDWGHRYPDSGWGSRFRQWLFSDETAPYGSFGNGAAMRVSPAALLARSLDEALDLARQTAIVTHDHPEGVKGAQATALAIWLARQGMDAESIRQQVAEFSGYNLNRSVADIRPRYRFNETCQGSVPEALICALEAEGFEDALRNAISIGGDSDTLAAIAGAVAEARFDIPQDIRALAWARLPADMRAVMEKLYARAQAMRTEASQETHAHSGPWRKAASLPARR
jgi:ADP-ribosylglycohydrolase